MGNAYLTKIFQQNALTHMRTAERDGETEREKDRVQVLVELLLLVYQPHIHSIFERRAKYVNEKRTRRSKILY